MVSDHGSEGRIGEFLGDHQAAILDVIEDAVISVDGDGLIAFWSRGAEGLLGYRPRDVFGRPASSLAGMGHPDIKEALAAREQRCLETIWRHKDGRSIDVEARISPLGGGAVVIARDVTRRKHEAEAQRWEEISRHMVAVQEAERHALAAELHDRTSGNLAALRLNLARLRQTLGGGASPNVLGLMDNLAALLVETTQGIRGISGELRPPLLDYFGLRPALEEYGRDFARHTGLAVEVVGDYAGRLMPDVEIALFRIGQEALANCAKHSRARRVSIDLSWQGERVSMTLADDGVGFSPAQLGEAGRLPGLGLLVMRERAELVGGSCSIQSAPGQGTRIEVLI